MSQAKWYRCARGKLPRSVHRCAVLGQARGGRYRGPCRTTVSNETYYSVKGDRLQCQKRPIAVSKETYYGVKSDLLQCQMRPTTGSKETYYSVKRDLLQCQKRPITVSKAP